MASEQEGQLQFPGPTLVGGIGTVIAISFFLGFYTLLVFIVILRQPSTRPKLTTIVLCLSSFMIAAAYWALRVASLLVVLTQPDFVEDTTPSLQAKHASATTKLYRLIVAIAWIASLVPILNDAVIIWRAWVLFPMQKWWACISVFLWMSTVVTRVTQLAFLARPLGVKGFLSGTNHLTTKLVTACVSLSLATNVVATSSIAYGLWRHRKLLAAYHSEGKRGDHVQKTLGLLVESGAVFCILQFITLILNAFPFRLPYSKVNLAAEAFHASYTELSAMYPTLVMFLAKGQGLFTEGRGYQGTQDFGTEASHRIVFASGPIESATDVPMVDSPEWGPTEDKGPSRRSVLTT